MSRVMKQVVGIEDSRIGTMTTDVSHEKTFRMLSASDEYFRAPFSTGPFV